MFEAWRRKVDVATFLTRNLAGKEYDELSSGTPQAGQEITRSGELAVSVIADMALDRKAWRE